MKSMKYFYSKSVFLLYFDLWWVISADEADRIFNPSIDFETKGFFTSKANAIEKGYLYFQSEELNHHGAFYADLISRLGINRKSGLSVRLNLENPKMCISVHPEARWYLLAYLSSNATAKKLFSWAINIGNLPEQTVGTGLTFKDFQSVGLSASLQFLEFLFEYSMWTKGYTDSEDINLFRFEWTPVPVGLNVIYWSMPIESNYYTIYLAPYFIKEFLSFNIYSEFFYRYLDFEYNLNESLEYYDRGPRDAFALNLGFAYRDSLFKFPIFFNPEFRYYHKGALPHTNIDADQFGSLYHYDKSTNNWIDFFRARLSCFLFYLKLYLESPSLKGFSLFCQNEILYFKSKQKDYYDK